MPYPVQPPKPPAIVQNSKPKELVTHQCTDVVCNVPTTQTPLSVSSQIPTTALATPTPPETFAPEPSPLKAAKSAALLGPSMSIGTGIQEPVDGAQDKGMIQEPVNTDQDKEPPTAKIDQISGKWENNPQKTALPAVIRLLTQERGKNEVREFDVRVPTESGQPSQPQEAGPKQEPSLIPSSTGQPQSPPAPQQIPSVVPPLIPQPEIPPAPQQIPSATPSPTPQPSNLPTQQRQPTTTPRQTTPPVKPITPSGLGGVVELTADRQEYDVDKQVITAEGNVLIRLQNGTVDADRAQVNLANRNLVAEGSVTLRRGEQILRGDRLEYNFIRDTGTILNASGEINQKKAEPNVNPTLPTDLAAAAALSRPLSDRILIDQPLQQVTYPGGYTFVFGSGRNFQQSNGGKSGGSVSHYRFQAERLDFDSQGWQATSVRITNDPFSPPELELRADTAKFRQIDPLVSELTTTNSRLAFDQGLQLPIFQDRRVIDRRPRQPALISAGYDGTDRGGLFLQAPFSVLNSPKVRLLLTPQYFLERGINQGTFLAPSDFGLLGDLRADLGPRTKLTGFAEFLTFDPTNLENKTRGSLRLNQTIGRTFPPTLTLEYSYRNRLFNGSLGFQTVQSNFGAVLTSPTIPVGKTGISLSYQGSFEYINSDTDRQNLLPQNRSTNRVSLSRYQGVVALNRGFTLWRGQGLPATATEGLRYTPVPVVPYLQLSVGTTGVATGYSSGDDQSSLSGNIRLEGQLGHFSRPFLDYTGFNIQFSQIARVGTSPFLFDRIADDTTLSGGITQQLYGPIRIGFQTSFNLNTGKEISTDYILEYSRRTYEIILRINPIQAIGSINLRINDFNWLGGTEPFENPTVRPVIQGVTR